MRRPEGEHAELWVSDIHNLFGIEPRVTQEYWSDKHRIVRPAVVASKPGGRNVYKAREVVKLLVAKQLAEEGMKLEEVQKVIRRMENKVVKMVKYPTVPNDLSVTPDLAEFKWSTGDPRGAVEGWWDGVTCDPFPDPEIATKYYAKQRGYPEMPTSAIEWKRYWGGVAQFILIDTLWSGVTTPIVLMPLHWLHSPHGRFIRIHDWFDRVIGGLAFEAVLRPGHEPLATFRILDIAQIKRKVADVLLGIPGDERDGR